MPLPLKRVHDEVVMQTQISRNPSDERVVPMGSNQRNYIEHLARYDFAKQFLRKRMCVLDAACGMGYGSHLLAEWGCRVTGCDVSTDALEWAKSHYQNENLVYGQSDCRRLEFPDDSFDAYISFETIEHFVEQGEYLAEAVRVVKTGGLFICSTPNKEVHEFYRRKGWMGSNPYHLKELAATEFRHLIDSHFPNAEYFGQDYDPLALKMREMNRQLSDLRWEMDRLPRVLMKSLLPRSIRKVLGVRSDERGQTSAQDYSLDMIKIGKLNIDNADTLIAVCRV